MRCGRFYYSPHEQKVDSALTKDSHAYLDVKCQRHGRDGFAQPQDRTQGHHKSFGTMMRAVNARALNVIGLKGDPKSYPFYDYDRGEGLPRA